jgi:hypothetical protein
MKLRTGRKSLVQNNRTRLPEGSAIVLILGKGRYAS